MNSGTLAYGVAAGFSGAIGSLFLFMAIRRTPSRRMDAPMALLGLSAAINVGVTLDLQTSDTVEEYGTVLKGAFAISGLVVIVSLVWLVAVATGVGWPRVPVALTVGGGVVAVVNFLTPSGLIVGDVIELREVSLLGESFVLHEPNRSSWRFVLDAYLLATALYVVWALVMRLRRHQRGFDMLGFGITIMFASMMYDSLVDEAVVDTAYLAPFGVIALTVVAAAQFTRADVDNEHRLLALARQLERLVFERTEALRESNRRTLDELSRQQTAARRMARLSEQFVRLNTLGVGDQVDSDVERGLADVLGCVGEIVGASAIHLDVRETNELSIGSVRLDWANSNGITPGQPNGDEVLQRTLRAGDLEVGELTLERAPGQNLSSSQLQLLELSTQFLAVALHRLSLVGALVNATVASERHRIARDLHDSVSQRLYAAAINADSLPSAVARDPDRAASIARKTRSLVLSSLAEMRTLLFELQPKAVESASMTTLIESLCESMEAGYDHPIEVALTDGPGLPTEQKLALYRIAQESLSNSLRHAHATRIAVSAAVDATGVVLEVIDDGDGFDARTIQFGHGLRNISERAVEVGVALDITTSAGSGTKVTATWSRPGSGDPAVGLIETRSELASR
ncbi:MAG: sensor histidine kinase [Acidimicrobiia bacterium]|nr:sensor histidine kinase [Acidimicrobiia bacterium]